MQRRRQGDKDRGVRDAQQVRDLLRPEHRVDRKRRSSSLASPDDEVGFGKVGQDERDGAIGRNAPGSESVCGACDVPNEFRVGPNVRFLQAVGRAEKGESLCAWATLRALDERRIGVRRQRALGERDGFNGKDIGQVADRHDGSSSSHRHGRAGFATLLFKASIFFSRGLSLRAVFRTPSSRRGVSLASMKSSGRSGPH